MAEQKNNTAAEKSIELSFTGIFASVLCAYVCALCSLPSSGLLNALPICAVLSVVSSFFCKNRKFIYGLMFLCPIILSALSKFSIARSITAGALCLATAFFAILAKRAVITYLYARKNKKDGILGKSMALSAISAVICVLIWLFGFGNPFLLLEKGGENEKYIKDNYGNAVKAEYTYYDVLSGSYLTEITFTGKENGERYYIESGKRDDFKTYHFEKIIADSEHYFSESTATDKGYILCRFDTDSYKFSGNTDSKPYYSIMEYCVVKLEKVVDNDDLYTGTLKAAMEDPSFVYKRIIVSAMDIEGNYRYAVKNYGEETEFFINDIELKNEIDQKFN